MNQRTTLIDILLLLLCVSRALGQNSTHNVTCSSRAGPCFDQDVFRKNLQYITTTVLPQGWKLNAVVKWEGYGAGLKATAAVAAEEGHSVGVLYNNEVAAAASVTPRPEIFRMFPANYSDLVSTIRAGYKTQELASPLNIADLEATGRATNSTIPIHLYLYKHYDDDWGWNFTTPQQLQAFVDQLDTRYVQVVGIMMHLNGYPDEQKLPLSQQFLQSQQLMKSTSVVPFGPSGEKLTAVACPVAATLAPQKIAVHWVNSDEALDLIPKPNKRYGNYRMEPIIPTVCNASNIEYWARMGTAIYGSFFENYADLVEGSGPGTAPVLRWTSRVQSVGQTTLPGGALRTVAVVDLSPARYPAPSWWSNAVVFDLMNSTNATSATAEGSAAADNVDEEGPNQDDETDVAAPAAAPEAAAAAPAVVATSGSLGRRLLQDAAAAPAAADAAESDGEEDEYDDNADAGADDDVSVDDAAPDPFGRPPLFVFINHQRMRLADWPAGNGSVILVDVTDADTPVTPEAEVCLLCEEQPVGTFGMEVGADEYNMALCLRGMGGTEATAYDDPNCTPWAHMR